jgi:hypothetical protein
MHEERGNRKEAMMWQTDDRLYDTVHCQRDHIHTNLYIDSMIAGVLILLVFACLGANAFLQPSRGLSTIHHPTNSFDDPSRLILQAAGTTEKPLYDGTNYTFPDTTKPAGIAELLETTFVNACFQLREGYVDVLKMFVAASMASYEFGYSIDEIQKELAICPKETANRPLMEEEVNLRHTWYCLVYLTLATLGHSTRVGSVADSIPADIRDEYQELVEKAVDAHTKGISLSTDQLLQTKGSDLSLLEKGLLSQSVRLVTLTFTVLTEAEEARSGDVAPPTPPIEGAF